MCIPGTRAGGAGGGGGGRKAEASGRAAGGRTGRALRRSTTKLSARCMRKRENLSAMIPSISSICLIFMLIRHCAAGRTKLSGLRPWQPRAPPARRRKGS